MPRASNHPTGLTPISRSIKKLLVRLTASLFRGLTGLKKVLNPLFLVLKKPFTLLWRGVFKALTVLYRWYLPISRKLRISSVFNRQRLTAAFSNKYIVHTIVIVLTFLVTASNIQAKEREVRADDYGRDSILYALVRPDEELIEETADDVTTSQIARSHTILNTTGSLAYNTADSVVIGDSSASIGDESSLSTSKVAKTEVSKKAADEPREHTVQTGETISTIAAKYGISSNTILWENSLSETSYIQPGDTLTILAVSGVSHTIKSGDTVLALADTYDVEAEEIVRENNLKDSSDITIGDTLIIPGGTKQITPAPATSTPSSRLATVTNSISAPATTATPSTPTVADAPASTSGSFQWPTNTTRISQYYGYYHTGLDIDGDFGDPVWAAQSGTVVFAGYNGGYGLSVVVDHGGGVQTRYAHMQKIYVQNGQSVSRGQTLGEEGSTGRSTGAHIHYEIMVNGRFVNPFTYH